MPVPIAAFLVALILIVLLLILLPVMRMSAWRAVIIGAVVTIILAITVLGAPVGDTFAAWGVGAGTGFWSINWITFRGVIIYNTPWSAPGPSTIAPQTTSVGVSTSKYVRREGQVIRYNLPWTLFMLGYLILIALFYRGVLPAAMQP